MADLTGQMLLDRYHIRNFIGSGGMARVYQAWDAKRAAFVAIKLLNEDMSEDAVFLRRFAREAQALEVLEHSHIVRFFGFEETHGLAFLVMEFIEGVTLRRYLHLLRRPLTLPEALYVTQPVCSALHYAHQMGVYHCDVKPANIFIERGGRVVLADFGIAQLSESATVTFSTPGTPAYMSPEQCQGTEDLDARADIYSLGVTTYEMLTLDRPFKGDAEGTTGGRGERVRWEQMHLPPPLPRSVNPRISPSAEAAILRSLEKDPGRRQQGALEFHRELGAAGTVQSISGLPWVEEPEALRHKPPPSSPPPGPHRGKVRTARLLPAIGVGVAVGGVVYVLLIAGLLGLAFDREDLQTSVTLTTTALTTVVTVTPTPLPRPTDTPWPTATPTPVTAVPDGTWVRPADNAVMIYIPAGEFEMGSTESDESGPHMVYLDDYWIDRTEVTNRQFRAFVEATGYRTTAESKGTGRVWMGDDWTYIDGASWRMPYGPGSAAPDNTPVVQASWYDASEYCRWVGGHLPTEAEWEKAARGTDGREYPWGSGPVGNRLNVCDRNCPANWKEDFDDGYRFSAPVGMFPSGASPYGVIDMAGNVWEWVYDWYDSGYYADSPYRNPSGPLSGEKKVLRGGSWGSRVMYARAYNRFWGNPYRRDDDIGFRCAVNMP